MSAVEQCGSRNNCNASPILFHPLLLFDVVLPECCCSNELGWKWQCPGMWISFCLFLCSYLVFYCSYKPLFSFPDLSFQCLREWLWGKVVSSPRRAPSLIPASKKNQAEWYAYQDASQYPEECRLSVQVPSFIEWPQEKSIGFLHRHAHRGRPCVVTEEKSGLANTSL